MSDKHQTDSLIPIGTRVRVSTRWSSWAGQTGIVLRYRGRPTDRNFAYWVDMPILHPTRKQPIVIDGEPQSLPQMFRPDELVKDEQ